MEYGADLDIEGEVSKLKVLTSEFSLSFASKIDNS